MKKKLVSVLLAIAATITFGYLFFLSLLLGFLASKYVAGKSVGERGKVRALVVPFSRWNFHLHHWLYSLCLIGFSSITGIHFLTPTITYGLLGGLVFQGIYCYSDWHIVLISKHQTTARDRRAQPVDLEAVIGRVKGGRSSSQNTGDRVTKIKGVR